MIKKIYKNRFVVIFFWLILLCVSLIYSLTLRRINYQTIPEPYIIFDEHTNIWHGLSLRKTGIPTAWSILPFYKIESYKQGAGGPVDGLNVSIDEVKPTFKNYPNFPKPAIGIGEFDFGRGFYHLQIVQPYIDHPPFGALVLSLFVSDGVKTLKDVSNHDLRIGALYLALITQVLIFILATLITKKPLVGIISSTIYGTVPSFVLLSRYALLENVLSPLILASFIFTLLAKDRRDLFKADKLFNFLLLLAGIFAGLGALTKMVGWIFIFSTFCLLCIWKFKLKEMLYFLVPSFLIGMIYFVWGMYLSPRLFLDLFIEQGQRDFIGSINILVTAFRVGIYNFPIDGWWAGGFISLLFLPKKREYVAVAIAAGALLFSALCVVGSNYPWYFIPLIPFMAIAIGKLLYSFSVKPTYPVTALILFAFISSSLYWGYGVFQKTQPFNLYRFVVILFVCAVPLWRKFSKNRMFKKLWLGCVLVLLIMLAVLNHRSMNFISDNWGKLPLIYTPGTF